MFKIKIEEKFNPKSDMIGKWFVKYESDNDKPIFTDEEDNAGIFIAKFKHKDSLYGNLMSLSDRFGYKGTPIPIQINDIKKRTDECSECDMMANYEDPDKWHNVEKCPKCGKSTQILKKAWINKKIFYKN